MPFFAIPSSASPDSVIVLVKMLSLNLLGCRPSKKINRETLRSVFARDIAHVCNNLLLQRKDHEESMNLGKFELML